jgi:hypothetical protein
MPNETLHHLYSSSDIIKVIKSNRINWTGHAERMGGMRDGKGEVLLVLK